VHLGYDPTGRMEPRDIVGSKEGWSEYTLDDGSILRGKVVILEAKRAVGQFNAEGDPVYLMQMTMVNQVKAPDNLRKGYVEPSADKAKD
jgi:S-adenosylhomocysteine hydrolase